MGLRMGALIIDSESPGRLARFWAEALGWVISHAEDPEWVVEPPAGSREDCVVPDLLLIKVPEHKSSKNRLHLDLRPDDQPTEIARLEGLGASRVDIGQGDDRPWVVMADPLHSWVTASSIDRGLVDDQIGGNTDMLRRSGSIREPFEEELSAGPAHFVRIAVDHRDAELRRQREVVEAERLRTTPGVRR
jgi:hypothetical protein